MSWLGLIGHDAVVERFRRSLAAGRLASTFLLVGPEGIGKRTFAERLAGTLLCETRPAEHMDPCGECVGCRLVRGGSHPDLLTVARPGDKSTIPVELLIGEREKRMQEGLCHDIALRPFRGGRRIALIDDADALNVEGANCLLKTLEEPPPGAVLLLISGSEQRQLPTIRSRCQVIRFAPLPTEAVAQLLVEQQLAPDAAAAHELALLARGSLAHARRLADPEVRSWRAEFLSRLARFNEPATQLAKEVGVFVDQAGKEAPPRRERLRLVIGFAIDLHRRLLLAGAGGGAAADLALESAAREALASSLDGDLLAALIERSLAALAQVDANANQATLIEAWLDDCEQLARGALR